MALSDPLQPEEFASRFKVQDIEFVQNFNQQSSMTGGGERRYADRAPAMIRAKITTIAMPNAEAEGIMALINSRAGGLKRVLLFNYRLPYPASDRDGAKLSGDASLYQQTWLPWSDSLPWNDDMPWGGSGVFQPKLGTITDRLHVAFTGFPPGYVIPLGTWFSIVFDTSRYYLGQFVEPAEASSSGAVASVEIFPPLPASVSGTPDVTMIKASGKFRIVPNSAFLAKEGGLHSTIQFSAEQTYSA